ncbi:protein DETOXIFICATION 55-like [Phalaenopsis equestris]|uniref:protein DETOXIFICATION 55-like n=1 Tax=Phalaenopsis equestris TaxID=78828 RepID=UPI0009E26B0F|nr:protein DETOXIFICATION 55-like [Phalaenopsis equestris]
MALADQYSKYTIRTAEISAEFKELTKICLPIVATNLVSYLKGMFSVAFMGRLGPLELAGGSLAVGLTNITGLSILSGLSLSLDPICSQASGSNNPSLAISALRRTILLLLIVSIPISALWFSLHSILISLFRLDPAVAAIAHSYVLFSLPSLLTSSILLPLRSYLRSLSRPLPFAAASTFSSLALHLPLAPFLSSSHLGISGIALSSSVSDFATLLLLAAYFSLTQNQNFNPSPSPLHVDGLAYLPLKPQPPPPRLPPSPSNTWSPLLRLSIHSCLAVCLEWWWYELVMTIAAGYLIQPQSSLAASGIVIQTTALLYTLPVTLSAAVSVRVGHQLGAGRPGLYPSRLPARALRGPRSAGSCGPAFSHQIALFFTVGCGVLRGCARPAVGAAINLYSFYFVGAPAALLLAFGYGMGFIGLCFGLLAAQVVCAVSIFAAIWSIDWDQEAQKANDLVGLNDAANTVGVVL